MSVDAPLSDDEGSSMIDVMTNEDAPNTDHTLMHESLSLEIDRALSVLNERERDIIKKFFGLGRPEMTLEEIGQELGLTRERVRQIKENAIKQLQRNSKNSLLKSYLG